MNGGAGDERWCTDQCAIGDERGSGEGLAKLQAREGNQRTGPASGPSASGVLVRSALPLRERGARCRARRRISTPVASGACCARPVRGSVGVSRLAGFLVSSTSANASLGIYRGFTRGARPTAPPAAGWSPAGAKWPRVRDGGADQTSGEPRGRSPRPTLRVNAASEPPERSTICLRAILWRQIVRVRV